MDSPLSTRAALLLSLRAGPGSGLRLIERLARVTGGVVRPAEGSAYPTLTRLLEEGLVKRRGRPAEKRRGRVPVDFELTPTGAAASNEVKRLLQRFTAKTEPRAEPNDAMRQRLREGMELSDFALRLRDRVGPARGART